MDYSEQIQFAAINGNWESVKYMYSKGVKLTDNMMAIATDYSQLEVIKWLYLNGVKINKNAMYYAAKKGDLEIVKWLFEHGGRIIYVAINNKAEEGSRILEYYLPNSSEIGSLKYIKRLDANIIFTCSIMDTAAENGHFELVKWLYNKSGLISCNAINHAIRGNHFNIAGYLKFEINKIAIEEAKEAKRVAEIDRITAEKRKAEEAERVQSSICIII
jgi:hypothetical protein